MRIELTTKAWEAFVLPLNYARKTFLLFDCSTTFAKVKQNIESVRKASKSFSKSNGGMCTSFCSCTCKNQIAAHFSVFALQTLAFCFILNYTC